MKCAGMSACYVNWFHPEGSKNVPKANDKNGNVCKKGPERIKSNKIKQNKSQRNKNKNQKMKRSKTKQKKTKIR